MGCYCKILVAVLVVAQAQAIEILRDEGDNVVVDMNWATILSKTTANQDMSVVCERCESMCPMPLVGYAGYAITHNEPEPPVPEMVFDVSHRDFRENHRSCAFGCKSSCLYQVGPKRYNYQISRRLCMQGCDLEYKVENPLKEKYLEHCNQGCLIRIAALIPKSYALELDEAESMLIDTTLDHGSSDGTLPRSSYKTIPHKDHMEKHMPVKHSLLDKSTFDHILSFFKDHKTDPILAGAVAIPLLLSLFGLMGYLLYLVSITSRSRNINQQCCSNPDSECQRSVTLLHVDLESEEKKALLSQSDIDMDDEFIPPLSPPPKYSDIVQTV